MDASATLANVLPDESDKVAMRAAEYAVEHGAIVPALWRWEVQNILLTALRRNRIDERQLLAARDLLGAFPFRVDTVSAPFGAELALARKHNLTVYDASYLELALRTGCKLATTDRALARAANEYGLRFA